MVKVHNGVGTPFPVRVDSQYRMRTHSVTETESLHSTEEGGGYNLNTGFITVSGDATMIYIKNTGEKDIVLERVFLGFFEGITHSDDPYFIIKRNPTAGDLISDATPVDMNANRNFRVSDTLEASVYKGKVGGTITGGADFGIFHLTGATRNTFNIEIILSKGDSFAVDLTANASSGSCQAYCGVACYVKDDTTD